MVGVLVEVVLEMEIVVVVIVEVEVKVVVDDVMDEKVFDRSLFFFVI